MTTILSNVSGKIYYVKNVIYRVKKCSSQPAVAMVTVSPAWKYRMTRIKRCYRTHVRRVATKA